MLQTEIIEFKKAHTTHMHLKKDSIYNKSKLEIQAATMYDVNAKQ